MPKPGSLIIVHFVEAQPIGKIFKRRRNDWPLHVTLFSWFTNNDWPLLERKLFQIASSRAAFSSRVGEPALFGPKADIPVSLLVDQIDIKQLHQTIAETVRESGSSVEAIQWAGEQFKAHITHHQEASELPNQGDTIQIKDFHVVRLLAQEMCEVTRQFVLGEAA